MSVIDELLRANAGYARTFDRGDLPTPPRLKLAIVTCMDSRIRPPARSDWKREMLTSSETRADGPRKHSDR